MMKPWGISNSLQPLSPLGLKGKRRKKVTQKTRELELGEGEGWNIAAQRAGRWGIDYAELSSPTAATHLPPHQYFPLAKTNWKPEGEDTWMMQPTEIKPREE